MTIIEYSPDRSDILTFVDDAIRQLSETDTPAKYIVTGPAAYKILRKAIGERFQRGAGSFETYQYLPIVVDPFRTTEVCVLPGAAASAEEAQPYRMPQED